MAPLHKEIINPKHNYNSSAPSSPYRPLQASLDGKPTLVANSDIKATAYYQKPARNYLKHTVNSSHSTCCSYPRHQQPQQQNDLDPLVASGKRRMSVSASSTLMHHLGNYLRHTANSSHETCCSYPKNHHQHEFAVQPITSTSTCKSPCLRPHVVVHSTPWNASPRRVKKTKTQVEKATSVCRIAPAEKILAPKKAKTIPKPSTKRIRKENEVIAKEIKMEAAGSGRKSPPSKHSSTKSSPSRKGLQETKELKAGATSPQQRLKLSPRNETEARKRFKLSQGTSRAKIAKGDEYGESVVLKRHEGDNTRRESLPDYNNVIEETANKILFTQRSKVRALTGAFETVIHSLQNTESHHSHHQGGQRLNQEGESEVKVEADVAQNVDVEGRDHELTLQSQLDWDIEVELSQLEQSQQEEYLMMKKYNYYGGATIE